MAHREIFVVQAMVLPKPLPLQHSPGEIRFLQNNMPGAKAWKMPIIFLAIILRELPRIAFLGKTNLIRLAPNELVSTIWDKHHL